MDHRRTSLLRRTRTAETEVDRRIAAVEKAVEFAGERTLVREDPRARLKHAAIRGVGPRAKRRIRRKPRLVCEHMTSHVADCSQSQRGPARVYRGAEQIVEPCRISRPQLTVVVRRGGSLSWQGRHRWLCMMRKRQH